jgi:hypothetical protein
MTTFDSRERAFENKYAYDLEVSFKANARRNKLFGLWAAERLSLDSPVAQEYAQQTVIADFEAHGSKSEVVRKVQQDLADAGIELTCNELTEVYDELMDAAINQLQKEA